MSTLTVTGRLYMQHGEDPSVSALEHVMSSLRTVYGIPWAVSVMTLDHDVPRSTFESVKLQNKYN